jgi:hypothetical protein
MEPKNEAGLDDPVISAAREHHLEVTLAGRAHAVAVAAGPRWFCRECGDLGPRAAEAYTGPCGGGAPDTCMRSVPAAGGRAGA